MKRITTPEFEELTGKCSDSNGGKPKNYKRPEVEDRSKCEALCTKDWCQAYMYAERNRKCYLYPASVKTDPGLGAAPAWRQIDNDGILKVTQGNGNEDFQCMRRIPSATSKVATTTATTPEEFEELTGKCLGTNGVKPTVYMRLGVSDQSICELFCSKDWCEAYAYGESNKKCYLYPDKDKQDPGLPDAPGWKRQRNDGIRKVTQGNAKLTAFKCMKRIDSPGVSLVDF